MQKATTELQNTLHIFDICGTLYKSNTTYDFLKYYFKRNNLFKSFFFNLCFSIPAKVIWKLLSYLGYSYQIRKFLIGFLRNESVITVQTEVFHFIDEFLNQKKIVESISKIEAALEVDNSMVYLVSASIKPVVQGIATKLGTVNYYGTDLEIKDNRYTGRIMVELEKNKLNFIKSEGLISSNNRLYVYTDSFSDSDLVAYSNYAFIVTNHAKRKKWKEKFIDKKIEFNNAN